MNKIDIDNEIKKEAELLQEIYNYTMTARKERIFVNTISVLLLAVAIIELIMAIQEKTTVGIIYSLQCFATYLIHRILNKGIRNERQLRYKKEAEACVYKKAFSEEWAKNVSNRKEQVRKEE